MLRVTIYHGNAQYAKVIKDLIYKETVYGSSVVFTYYNKERILQDFSKDKSVDVLIADVKLAMQDEQGILKLFQKRLPDCILVLVSKDGLIDAELLKLNPFRCLYERDISVKNIMAIRDVVAYAELMKNKIYIWGWNGKVSYKISPSDIMYVSIAKHGSIIHLNPKTEHGRIALEMRNSAKLSELFDTVGRCGFAYAHNSYFINLEYVENYSGTQVEMEDGSILSISRSKGKNFEDAFRDYWSSCMA